MNVAEDGSLRGGSGSQISIPRVLYNASICAHKIGNYLAAYECMSRFMASSLSSSEFFTRDPFSWRLLGESCIGKSVDAKSSRKRSKKCLEVLLNRFCRSCSLYCFQSFHDYVV